MRPWPELALGRMRAKIGDLSMVLEGRFDEPHALMCRLHLQHLDLLDQRLAKLDAQVEEMMVPFRLARELLTSIPGIGPRPSRSGPGWSTPTPSTASCW
ncbi:hypothetical protein ACTWPT_37370 [Nonomuraea sp. 3N208]|uniref:hypothetical protein n=1 Tax=Nonomuraea sp. 3N208 TaxID=3457421 RepID=UPI003FCF05AF